MPHFHALRKIILSGNALGCPMIIDIPGAISHVFHLSRRCIENMHGRHPIKGRVGQPSYRVRLKSGELAMSETASKGNLG